MISVKSIVFLAAVASFSLAAYFWTTSSSSSSKWSSSKWSSKSSSWKSLVDLISWSEKQNSTSAIRYRQATRKEKNKVEHGDNQEFEYDDDDGEDDDDDGVVFVRGSRRSRDLQVKEEGTYIYIRNDCEETMIVEVAYVQHFGDKSLVSRTYTIAPQQTVFVIRRLRRPKFFVKGESESFSWNGGSSKLCEADNVTCAKRVRVPDGVLSFTHEVTCVDVDGDKTRNGIRKSNTPTRPPTRVPTANPTVSPSLQPSVRPTAAPVANGTSFEAPTTVPTVVSSPTTTPTLPRAPTTVPTVAETTIGPTIVETEAPTVEDTFTPTTEEGGSFVPATEAPTEGETAAPTEAATTLAPTVADTTLAPTQADTTLAPTEADSTLVPTEADSTLVPTFAVPDLGQVDSLAPTEADTLTPTQADTTLSPTPDDTSQAPTQGDSTIGPTIIEREGEMTNAPSAFETTQPTVALDTDEPTANVETFAPTDDEEEEEEEEAFVPETILALNAGGTENITFQGVTWQPDTPYVTGGTTNTFDTNDIVGTEADFLYHDERFGTTFVYELPVPVNDAPYRVILHFAEVFASNQEVGARVFTVNVENGQRVFENVDIFQAVGANRPLLLTADVFVTDGSLTVQMLEGTNRRPKISGLQLLPLTRQTNNAVSSFPQAAAAATTTESKRPVSHMLDIVLQKVRGAQP